MGRFGAKPEAHDFATELPLGAVSCHPRRAPDNYPRTGRARLRSGRAS